jgi:hypothetical protein
VCRAQHTGSEKLINVLCEVQRRAGTTTLQRVGATSIS